MRHCRGRDRGSRPRSIVPARAGALRRRPTSTLDGAGPAQVGRDAHRGHSSVAKHRSSVPGRVMPRDHHSRLAGAGGRHGRQMQSCGSIPTRTWSCRPSVSATVSAAIATGARRPYQVALSDACAVARSTRGRGASTATSRWRPPPQGIVVAGGMVWVTVRRVTAPRRVWPNTPCCGFLRLFALFCRRWPPSTPDASCSARSAASSSCAGSGAEGKVRASDLALRLRVSLDTVRRDLQELADAGLLRRVHGGALPPSPPGPDSFVERLPDDVAAKARRRPGRGRR